MPAAAAARGACGARRARAKRRRRTSRRPAAAHVRSGCRGAARTRGLLKKTSHRIGACRFPVRTRPGSLVDSAASACDAVGHCAKSPMPGGTTNGKPSAQDRRIR
ncbi:hypothetical protein WS86_09735 [Burkholderia savannae]|nr:hypothetical protein WS86_09735 [Burkholderia savannae]